jgi:addiction module RelE/StbE family toxin
VTVRFTPQALAEYAALLAYVEARSLQGAKSLNIRIDHHLQRVEAHPLIGTATSLTSMRRVTVTPYPYLIFYLVEDDGVTIVGLRHAARSPKDMPVQS